MSSAVITCADTSVLSNMMTHEALPGRKPKHPHPAVVQRCSSWYRYLPNDGNQGSAPPDSGEGGGWGDKTWGR